MNSLQLKFEQHAKECPNFKRPPEWETWTETHELFFVLQEPSADAAKRKIRKFTTTVLRVFAEFLVAILCGCFPGHTEEYRQMSLINFGLPMKVGEYSYETIRRKQATMLGRTHTMRGYRQHLIDFSKNENFTKMFALVNITVNALGFKIQALTYNHTTSK